MSPADGGRVAVTLGKEVVFGGSAVGHHERCAILYVRRLLPGLNILHFNIKARVLQVQYQVFPSSLMMLKALFNDCTDGLTEEQRRRLHDGLTVKIQTVNSWGSVTWPRSSPGLVVTVQRRINPEETGFRELVLQSTSTNQNPVASRSMTSKILHKRNVRFRQKCGYEVIRTYSVISKPIAKSKSTVRFFQPELENRRT